MPKSYRRSNYSHDPDELQLHADQERLDLENATGMFVLDFCCGITDSSWASHKCINVPSWDKYQTLFNFPDKMQNWFIRHYNGHFIEHTHSDGKRSSFWDSIDH